MTNGRSIVWLEFGVRIYLVSKKKTEDTTILFFYNLLDIFNLISKFASENFFEATSSYIVKSEFEKKSLESVIEPFSSFYFISQTHKSQNYTRKSLIKFALFLSYFSKYNKKIIGENNSIYIVKKYLSQNTCKTGCLSVKDSKLAKDYFYLTA